MSFREARAIRNECIVRFRVKIGSLDEESKQCLISFAMTAVYTCEISFVYRDWVLAVCDGKIS